MSSDLYVHDESLFLESVPPIINSFLPNMKTDPDDPQFLDQLIAGLSPSYRIENLSLYQSTQLRYGDSFETEDLGSSGGENVVKMMQRSFSSNYAPFDPVAELPETRFLAGQLRRACSTGDLPVSSQTHSARSSFMEFKIGRYSAEERKERILRYRAKRKQRNFNKTITYHCRKTLADNRRRIRGRFVRNDETGGEIPQTSCSDLHEEDEEFLHGGSIDEEHGAFMEPFMKHFGQTQFQYYYGY